MTAGNASQWQENIADIASGIDTLASAAAGVQYTDGAAAPAHPIGNELVYNNAGIMTAVSAANPLPVSATVNPPAIQRVDAQSGDFPTGAITDLATLLTLAGTPTDANTVNSLMGRLTKIRDLLNATLTVNGSVTANAGTNLNTSALALETGGNLAAAKADLDTLAGVVSSNKAAVKSATNDIVDLATLLARLTDTFGNNTAISAATTFGSIPLVSAIAANSSANLTNSSYQDTFIAQINVASAFNGTIGFYGLLPDGSTLQQINAHQRNSSTTNNSTAINTSSALEQTWAGSIAGFKAVYVVCTTFTSGSASVQIGLTASPYALAILNTVAQNLTQVNGSSISLGQTTKANSLPVTIASDQGSLNNASVGTDGSAIPTSSTLIGASDGTNLQQLLVESASNRNLRTAIYNAANELGIDSGGRITALLQAVAGTALGTDQSGTQLKTSTYVKKTTAGDTALTLGQNTKANSIPITLASDQDDVRIMGDFTEMASLSAGSLNADLVPSTDVNAYKWLSLHINGNAYSGTLTFQASNDNTNWISINLLGGTSLNNASTTTTSTNALFTGPVYYRYFRVRMTSYTSGTAQGTLQLYTSSAFYIFNNLNASQSGTWTVQPGNTQNTTAWLVAGPTNNATQAANTAGNVVVKGSAGYLHSAVITATGTAQLDIYDNASTNSGTKLLSIPANAAVGTIYAFPGGARASNGIVSNGVANCPGVTFQYQ